MKNKRTLTIIGIIIGACILCVITLNIMDATGILPDITPIPTTPPVPTSTLPPTLTPAQTYLNEYGGMLEVYNEIFAITDCKILQAKFETAYANNQRETPGTPLFKVTLGYMTATDDHMRALGCYNN